MSWLRVLMILFCAAAGIARASITAAWKIPVERVAPSYADAPPLAKPPGDSAFFQPGDKIWDLSKCIYWNVLDFAGVGESDLSNGPAPGEVKIDWKGDWIVWNSRSGMIVARGSWHDVLVAEQVLRCDELPKVIRTRIEVKGTGKPRSLSLISRSGEKASLEMNELLAEVETTSSSDGNACDTQFFVSWPAEDSHWTWEVKTAVTLGNGSPCQIACQGTKDQRWELVVSTEEELMDGTPSKEFCWVETPDGLRAWSNSGVRGKPLRKQLDANRWLGIYPMAKGSASHFLAEARSRPGPDVTGPELAEWTRMPLLNIRPVLEERGVAFRNERDCACIDPLTGTAFVLADQVTQDLAEYLFASVLDGELVPPIWIETNPESGGWGLASRSGERAEIRRSSSDPGNQLLFRSEATEGGDGVIFDLGYAIDVVSGDVKIGKLEANTTLTKDKPQVIGSGTAPDGKEVKVTVTVSKPPSN
ncbi:hypothetical protein [Luteolibacter soli]|uniref:Uncharacterized protein n=1 Tax=Luteolibacter soli TaxID=3135280 RepID=A0ABU9ATI3_9BACT